MLNLEISRNGESFGNGGAGTKLTTFRNGEGFDGGRASTVAARDDEVLCNGRDGTVPRDCEGLHKGQIRATKLGLEERDLRARLGINLTSWCGVRGFGTTAAGLGLAEVGCLTLDEGRWRDLGESFDATACRSRAMRMSIVT